MLVLRELAYGPRRFSELKADLQGISANVLAQRLTELERRGLVRKTRLPPPASVQVYEASKWGLEAVPVIASLGRWAVVVVAVVLLWVHGGGFVRGEKAGGDHPYNAHVGRWAARSPCHDPTLPMSHVSLIMSLQTLLSPELAEGLDARIGFRLGEASYVTVLHDGQLDVTRGEVEDCDVEFVGTPSQVAAVIHGGAPFDLIKVQGDMRSAKRFVTLFPLPTKVGEC